MTTPVCVRRRIRQLDRQGLSHREISRKLGVSRTTVVKYANHGDCSPKPLGSGHAGRSLVDAGYSAVVDGWPAADLRMPVKQRHTATRVYERLVAECGFTGSYSSVRRWVKRWRREHRVESDGFAELEWAPGSAQVDFGQARAVVAGVERVVHFLVVSFPYVFCQVGVGRFGVSFSPCERRVSGRFGVGRSCWLLVIALVIA